MNAPGWICLMPDSRGAALDLPLTFQPGMNLDRRPQPASFTPSAPTAAFHTMQKSSHGDNPCDSLPREPRASVPEEVNMDVFISWSGPQSKQVAEALRLYLPSMIQAIKPWLSSSDVEAGARWATDIAENLQKSKVGVLCLTPANLDAPWIHFEAGALAKTIEHTYVCPFLTDLKETDVKGPLTQFQMKSADEEGTRGLLETLNRALNENALHADALTAAFSMWWPKLKEKLEAIPQEEPSPKKRPVQDMLEELLELARRQARPTNSFTAERIARDTMRYVASRLRKVDPQTDVRILNDNDRAFLEIKAPGFGPLLLSVQEISPASVDSLVEALTRRSQTAAERTKVTDLDLP